MYRPSAMELVACFQDTMNLAWKGALASQTQEAVQTAQVYREGFTTERLYKVQDTEVLVWNTTSFAAARQCMGAGRVAVLNFANPHYPGGGVTKGAMAQEECLCRSSNLYACLSAPQVQDGYYAYNREHTDYFFSDRLIYARGVTVFKSDDPLPVILPREEWFRVDVITCAAPYLGQRRYTNSAALKQTFQSRIRNIFEAAIHNGVEVLILGAFGCGVYKNPPEVVAAAFHEVLQESRYRSAFHKVVFAIGRSVLETQVCPNLAAFEKEFYGVSAELTKLRLVNPGTAPYSECLLPGGRILKDTGEWDAYNHWRRENPYFGKQFSVLGDSISTLDGFNPRGFNLYYQGQTCEDNGVREMKDTWWGKVIDFFGGELLVNNAWSGSRVTVQQSSGEPFPSGCSSRRTGGLHIGNVKPDVILVYMGVNDWLNGVPLGDSGNTEFSCAYHDMLDQLRMNYPSAQIWCCTLSETYVASNPGFCFPSAYGGTELREYNRTIRESAAQFGCQCLDIYSMGMPFDTMDGIHPTAAGMDTLAWTMLAALDVPYIQTLPDSKVGQKPEPVRETKDAVLRLWLKAEDRILEFSGPHHMAGRGPDCDLRLTSPYAARYQATLIREGNQWFLRDNNSKNGTYVNGVRMEAGALVMLKRGDKICFARKEEAEVM